MTRIYLSPPHMHGNELELLTEAYQSNWIAPLGPFVDQFEIAMTDRLGTGHAVALSSGTAALHLALLLTGVRPGSDVLLPTLTFAATANAVVYVGANPVFVDADPATWQIDPQLVLDELDRRAAASALPAAVITVDLYGQCADHDPIASRCRELGIPLIEDAAEALGATYRGRPAGSLGDIGVFSFNGNKVITTSGGGMLVTESEEQAARARFLATQARDAAAHYEHSVVGYNYRLSNLLAALGVAQMSHLSDHVDRRREHNHIYRESLDALPGVAFMPAASYGVASWWLTALTIDPAVAPVGRDDVIAALADIGIEARPVWKPMHRQPVFRDRATLGGAVSEAIFNDGLCLPSGSSLTDDERAEVISCVRQVVGGAAGSLRRQGLGLS